jgi:hypothetical protein
LLAGARGMLARGLTIGLAHIGFAATAGPTGAVQPLCRLAQLRQLPFQRPQFRAQGAELTGGKAGEGPEGDAEKLV